MNKNSKLTIRMIDREVIKLEEEAKKLNLSISNFIRMKLFGYKYLDKKENKSKYYNPKYSSGIDDNNDIIFSVTQTDKEYDELFNEN